MYVITNHLLLTLLWLQGSKCWYTCQGISSALESQTRMSNLMCSIKVHLQVTMSRPFLTGKNIVLYCWGWSKMTVKTSQNASVCAFGSTTVTSVADHFGYLPLKFSCSRRVNTVSKFVTCMCKLVRRCRRLGIGFLLCIHFMVKQKVGRENSLAPFYVMRFSTIIFIAYTGNLTKMAAMC